MAERLKGSKNIGGGTRLVALAITPQRLTDTTREVESVNIQALRTNTGFAYIGGVNISATTGIGLTSGESVNIDIDDLYRIWIAVSVNGEGVVYTWIAEE